MKTNFLIALILTLVIISAPQAAFAFTQVLGKKDTAPGQTKNQGKETQVELDINVGRLQNIKPGKLEIESQGKKFEINTDLNTPFFEEPSGKRITPGDIKKDDLVATIATASANIATRSAHLVLVRTATSSAETKKRRAIYGLVRTISGNILTVSHPIKDDPRYQVQVLDTTVVTVKGLAHATLADIKTNDRIAAVGTWSGNILVAKIVHVIPGKAIGLLEKVATSSATPTATASATPSATPISTPSATPAVSPTP